jgi:hypothetical protein
VNVKLDILHVVHEGGFLFSDTEHPRWPLWMRGEHLPTEQLTQIRFLEVDFWHCIDASWSEGRMEVLQRFKDLKVAVLRVSAMVASERGTLAALFERRRTGGRWSD